MIPRLSIITPCLNRAKYIEEAIQSVLRQDYPDVEHIIIDGGSTDGTLDILGRYPHLKMLSEPDRGMYDALNKGLRLATGEIVGFLNTDDLYPENTFLSALKFFEDQEIQAIAGRARFFTLTAENLDRDTFELSPPLPARLIDESITSSTIFNAWFFRKSLLLEVGGFDPKYIITGDADLILRLAIKGIRYTVLDTVVYNYRQHEGSLTMQLDSAKLRKVWDEHVKFRNTYVKQSGLPRRINKRMNELCANTCTTISSRYRQEKDPIHSLLWALKAASYAPYYYFRARLMCRRGRR